jgi:hypothetical protein
VSGDRPNELVEPFGSKELREADLSPVASPDLVGLDFEMVIARNVMLDALDALSEQRSALTVIGAQAVYEHTKLLVGRPSVATKDADVCVDPSLLASGPLLVEAMERAGFVLSNSDRPGIWGKLVDVPGLRETMQVDLLVPNAAAGAGTRGARLGVHGKRAAGRAEGLEMVMLDFEVRRIDAIDGSNRSAGDVKVAGIGALLCAKSYKLAERLTTRDRGGRNRVRSKDAGDVWRLMLVSDPRDISARFDAAERHRIFGPAVNLGRSYLRSVFAPGTGEGLTLAEDDLENYLNVNEVHQQISVWMSAFNK